MTGFLGAGKTTLINRLLRAADLADALGLVNEWGEIGLDNLLYERLAGDAILVSGGCVCCALRGDLVDALRDALGAARFRRAAAVSDGSCWRRPGSPSQRPFSTPFSRILGLATRLVLAGVDHGGRRGQRRDATARRAARKRAPGRARRPAGRGEDAISGRGGTRGRALGM